MRRGNLWFWCVAMVALVAACGGPEGTDGADLSMAFAPRDLPIGATMIGYYVLPERLPSDGNSTAACVRFMGKAAVDDITDFTGDTVIPYNTVAVPAGAPTTLTIKGLPEGKLLFYLDVTNSSFTTLACGCGQDTIAIGKKTPIPIALVTDCK